MKMGKAVKTLIIESRSLVREALASLLAGHSYQVIGRAASTADMDTSLSAKDVPGLVVLGSLPADEVVSAARDIRTRWPEAKIALLFDHASSADFQKLLTSDIDGCVPLFASQDTLIDTLEKIVTTGFRILIQKSETGSSMLCATAGQAEANPSGQTRQYPARSDQAENNAPQRTPTLNGSWGLSPREGEVLKGVAKGLSNKMIGRLCGTTDSTIKVHMKSILRKIRVQNRTQAAIWAVEHSY